MSITVSCWYDRDAAVCAAVALVKHEAVKETILAASAGAEPISDLYHIPKLLWCAPPSRGEQMNMGASFATADILLFYHVNSELTGEHIDAVVRKHE